MVKAVRTIGVLISGSNVSGMNAAIRAVVRTAINKGLKVKGIIRGYADLPEEGIVNVESTSVSDIIDHGSTILYTARHKEFTTAKGQQKSAGICCKCGIDGMVVTGEDGSFRGTEKLLALGINTTGLLGTIDLDITRTDYTIGSDTAVNAAMEAIGKIRDTSIPHEQCGIMEVTGHNAEYIALWCGIRNGVEDILPLECYDGNRQALINRIIDNRGRGKKRNVIIGVEGIGHSGSMAKHTEVATGTETGATTLGHMQRGGTSTYKGRVYASIMGAKTAELLAVGKSNRLVAHRHGEFVDFDIQEALNMAKDIPEKQYEIAKMSIR